MLLIDGIVATAAIGGFMFGSDSGVIDGTQDGLEQAVHLSKLGTGLKSAVGHDDRRIAVPAERDHRGRAGQAEAVLARLIGPGAAADKVQDIAASLAAGHRPRFADRRGADGRIRPLVRASIGLAVFQQLVGITVTYGFYAASAMLSYVFVKRFVRETRGAELEEMPA